MSGRRAGHRARLPGTGLRAGRLLGPGLLPGGLLAAGLLPGGLLAAGLLPGGLLAAGLLTAGLSVVGCSEAPAPPPHALTAAPPPVLRAPAARGPDPVRGEPLPADAPRWRLEGDTVRVGTRTVDVRPPGAAAALVRALPRGEGSEVVLQPDGETFLAQAAPLLAALDGAGARVWLEHPAASVGLRVRLRDEPAFQAWLDEPVPGKVRVVQRGDGFELATNLGKLPGPDPHGPSVPLRAGRQDVGLLREGLTALRGRFPDAPDVCFVPSFGMELARVAEALAGAFSAEGAPLWPERCLVYPRPR